MFIGLKGPVIFLSHGSVVPAPAFPPQGSSGRFPCLDGTVQVLWLPAVLPIGLVSLPGRTASSTEATGSPRFLGNPFACMPCSSTPTGPRRQACYVASVLPSVVVKTSAPASNVSKLHHTACMLTVYASRPGLPQGSRKTRFQLEATPGWPGFSPGGFLLKVSALLHRIASSFSRLTWRTTTRFKFSAGGNRW